jgi:hypothetical protein
VFKEQNLPTQPSVIMKILSKLGMKWVVSDQQSCILIPRKMGRRVLRLCSAEKREETLNVAQMGKYKRPLFSCSRRSASNGYRKSVGYTKSAPLWWEEGVPSDLAQTVPGRKCGSVLRKLPATACAVEMPRSQQRKCSRTQDIQSAPGEAEGSIGRLRSRGHGEHPTRCLLGSRGQHIRQKSNTHPRTV